MGMRPGARVVVWAAAALLVVVGCHDPRQLHKLDATALFDRTELDFGEVPVGQWEERGPRHQHRAGAL